MKKTKILALVAVMLVCMLVMSACGPNWPASYTFNGQLASDTGAADVVLELKEDKTVSMEASIGDALSGKWSGTWEQNDDGTVTVTFAAAESEAIDPAPAFGMTLNDTEVDLGGMGGLVVTSTISEDSINTVVVKVNVAIGGGYTMAFDGELVQQPAVEE